MESTSKEEEKVDDRRVFVWGCGLFELGLGGSEVKPYRPRSYSNWWDQQDGMKKYDNSIAQYPTEITKLQGIPIVSISSGPTITIAITGFRLPLYSYDIETAELYVWGIGRDNQLGNIIEIYKLLGIDAEGDEKLQIDSPTRLPTLQGSCGYFHTAIVSEENVLVWGMNNYGQLGVDSPPNSNNNGKNRLINIVHSSPIPIPVPLLKEKRVFNIACGQGHTLCATEDGVYAWGQNTWGQLGFSDRSGRRYPFLVPFFKEKKLQVIGVSCGQGHSLAVTEEGKVFGWGLAAYGQLGLGETDNGESFIPIPQLLSYVQERKIVQVACGDNHSILRDYEGRVYACGHNLYGQCGQGNKSDQRLPLIVQFEASIAPSIVYVASGLSHCAAVSDEGGVFTWGQGGDFQLGHGQRIDYVRATQVERLKDLKITTVSCGSTFTVASTSGGYIPTQNLKEALFSPIFSDIHLRVKDENGNYVVVHAHKIVIWSRSETLLKEFTLREFSDPDTFTLDSISLVCLKRILEYLYTDHFAVSIETWTKELLDEFINIIDRHPSFENLSKRCKQMGFVSSLHSDFRRAVNCSEFSDIALLTSDSKIPAHRVLLNAKSVFFKAMLASSMKETRLREISLETTSSELLLLLLEFIYTERIQKLPVELALELLELSDRFTILGKLTRLCEDALRTAIDNSNVVDVIQFANLHQARLLKRVCIQYIIREYNSLEEKINAELPADLLKEIKKQRDAEFASSKEGIEKKLRQERRLAQEEERKQLAEASKESGGGYGLMAQLMK